MCVGQGRKDGWLMVDLLLEFTGLVDGTVIAAGKEKINVSGMSVWTLFYLAGRVRVVFY